MGIITVANQQVANGAVVINNVQMPGPGTLALFASDANGGLVFPPIGFISLLEGDYRDVVVNLTVQPSRGDKLFVVLEKPGSYQDPYFHDDKVADATFQII